MPNSNSINAFSGGNASGSGTCEEGRGTTSFPGPLICGFRLSGSAERSAIEMLCGAGQGKALLRKALHAHGRRRAASPSAIHLQIFRLQE